MRVKTRFEADDKVSKTFRKMEKNARRFGDQSSRSFRKAEKSALGFKSVLKGILAASVIQRGFGAMGQGLRFVASEFVGFEDAITGAAVKFKDLDMDAADFNKQIKNIGKSARDTAAATLFTPEQAAQGMLFMAKAGFTSEEAMKGLKSMIFLATATGEDFMQVADQSSDLLGAFGLSAENATQKIKNLNRLNDVLAVTSSSANVTVNDMFDTMKQIGPIATGILGASLEEVAALTAVLGNSGIKGSDAMTALKNAYLRLSAATGPGAKVMKMFALTLKDGQGGVKKMTDLLEELTNSAQFKGMDKVDQAAVLDAIFGKRAIAGSKNLMDNVKAIRQYEKRAINAAGVSEKMAAAMQKTLGGRLKILGSTLTELGFQVLDPFETKIKNNITALTEFFRGTSTKGLTDSIKEAGVYFEETGIFTLIQHSLKTSVETVKTLAKIIKPTLETLKPLVTFLTQELETLLGLVDRANLLIGKEETDPSKRTIKDQLRTALQGVIFSRGFIEKILLGGLTGKGLATPTPGQLLNEAIDRRQQTIAETERTPGQGMLPPEFLGDIFKRFLSPQVNVDVQNNINAEGVTVDTSVKAPGTSGKVGQNSFE